MFQKWSIEIRKLGPREWAGSMHVLVEEETFNMWVNAWSSETTNTYPLHFAIEKFQKKARAALLAIDLETFQILEWNWYAPTAWNCSALVY
jgi:hypothetical protein